MQVTINAQNPGYALPVLAAANFAGATNIEVNTSAASFSVSTNGSTYSSLSEALHELAESVQPRPDAATVSRRNLDCLSTYVYSCVLC